MQDLQEHEIVGLGEFVESFLRAGDFNTIYTRFIDSAMSRLLSTQPHEQKARETEYLKITAVREFVEHMVSFAEAGAKIKAKSAEVQRTDEEVEGSDEFVPDAE
jgi:hypothetical protein